MHTMARDKDSMSADSLRAAVEKSGLSIREISRRADLDVGIVSRLVSGARTVTLPTADRLAAALGMQWRLVKARKQKGR